MKNISSKILAFILGGFLLSLTACTNDDDYSLGKFWVEVATIQPLEGGAYYIQLDNGQKLWPAASAASFTPKYGRAQVNYTKLSDQQGEYAHYVRVNYLQYILTKDIVTITSENNEELGNDKVKILEYWVGDDFLNIHFGYNAGGDNVTHFINMGENKSTTAQPGVVNLEFRHNANNDEERFGVKSLVAFDLRPYQVDGRESVDIVIKVNSFTEVKEYKFTYKYKNTDANNSETHTFGEPLTGGGYE